MKKAVIYLRTSSDKQIDNTSIPTQEAKCREYCQRENLEIFDIQKREAVSANGEKDERMKELLRYSQKNKGKFDVLVVYKLDRFARDTFQHLLLRKELEKINIVLRSTSERVDETPQGKFLETVLAGVNQWDNDVRKERVKIALQRRVEEGLWPWAPPVGYYRQQITGVRLSVSEWDPNCAKEIIKLFELYSTGIYSFSSLTSLMNQRNVKNHKGKTIKFSKQLIQRMLNNQFYIGILEVKDYPIKQGQHKPLISTSLWQKCQDLINKKSNHTTAHRLMNNPEFPLRRFTACGSCNHPLTACWSKGGSGGKYGYYYCVNKNCDKFSVMVTIKNMHDGFFDYLAVTKPKEEYLILFREVFIRRYHEREKEFKDDYLKKIKEIEKLELEKKEIAIKGAKGIYPDLTLKELLNDYEQKILLGKNSLNELHHEQLEIEPLLDKAFEVIRTLEKGWYEAPPEGKTKLQRLIYPSGVSYHYSGFSNSELNFSFALINDVTSQPSTNVSLERLELSTNALRGHCSTS